MTSADLPHLNALLNASSAVLLVLGRRAIRSRRVDAHRRLMVGATAVSAAFLVTYLAYHALHGSTRFGGQGWVRPVYFAVLVSHTILAVLVPPLAIASLWAGLRGRLALHRRLVRYAWPIWIYVSLTGVVVYLMLYHLHPRA